MPLNVCECNASSGSYHGLSKLKLKKTFAEMLKKYPRKYGHAASRILHI